MIAFISLLAFQERQDDKNEIGCQSLAFLTNDKEVCVCVHRIIYLHFKGGRLRSAEHKGAVAVVFSKVDNPRFDDFFYPISVGLMLFRHYQKVSRYRGLYDIINILPLLRRFQFRFNMQIRANAALFWGKEVYIGIIFNAEPV